MLKLADLAVREDFSLGPLWVSPALRLVKGPAGELHVEPLTMQVFLLLADAKGQVVTRNRLYDDCWGGVNVGDYSLNRTITMVRRIAAEAAPGAFRIESIPRTGYRLLVGDEPNPEAPPALGKWRRPAILGGAIAAAALAASAWFIVGRAPGEPSVAISAGSDSTELAAAIASAAMSTAAKYETPLRLLADSGASGGRADFVLNVRKSSADGNPAIELALVSGRDKSLLWTGSVTEPATPAASLDQEAKMIGGSVLACAAETRADARRLPDEETVKLYLDACSKFESWFAADARLLPDAFEKVTIKAPQLRGAWSKLFLSRAEAIEAFPPVNMVNSLKEDLARSMARHVEVPETYIARASVLSLNARFERLQLYEAGLARYPRNPFLLSARSWQLRSVGRMDEAARTAGTLVSLYPDSAAANTEYVQSLMSSGRVQQARNVLERAAKLAPGAPNLRGARWRLEMRYGDPKAALDMARTTGSVVDASMISFLRARINPTRDNIDRAVTDMEAAYRADPREPGILAQGLGAFGRTEDAIQLLLRYDGSNSGDGAEMLFRPPMREVRHDPRFILIARNFGITDYWMRSGILPDFCFDPDLPYDCRQELARLRK